MARIFSKIWRREYHRRSGRCCRPPWCHLAGLPCSPSFPSTHQCSDYRPMEHLDRYEGTGLDDAYVDDVTEEERLAARAAAERELARRDAIEGRLTGHRRGLPAALEEDLDDEDEGRPRRRRRMEEAQADEQEAVRERGRTAGQAVAVSGSP